MGLDAFGRMVRDIRLVRALLLYDMAVVCHRMRKKKCSRLVRL